MDATGMGMQLAERARERFRWKVEPITFTAVPAILGVVALLACFIPARAAARVSVWQSLRN